jgi:zinc protease
VSATDRSSAPAGGAPAPFRFPSFRRERLSTGLELLTLPRPGSPIVEIGLVLPAGGERVPAGRPGLAALTAALADEGTTRRSGLELALELERLGASLSSGADWDKSTVDLSVLEPDLPVALERLAEVVREPSFPDSEVERIRAQWLADLDRRADQPGRLADEAVQALLYAGSRYEHPLHGEPGSLREVHREEIREFHAETWRWGAGAAFVAGGAIDPDRLRSAIESLFGAPPPPPGAAPRVEPDALRFTGGGRRLRVVDLPHAAQAELRVGGIGVPRSHPDRPGLSVLNGVLGGKFTSRLNLNLRERRGITYGVSSRFVDRRGPGPFLVSTAVATESTGEAVREILAELDRLRQERVSAAELEETRDYLTGVFPYTLQTVGGVLARLVELAVHGLADDEFASWLRQVRETDAERLLELARRHLPAGDLAIVAVGPAASLVPQLEPFGELEIVRLDERESGTVPAAAARAIAPTEGGAR